MEEKIIDYLDGLLSPEESAKFEQLIKKDKSLQDEIKLYKEGKEFTDNFNQSYHQEDDINYDELKKKAFKQNTKRTDSNFVDNLLNTFNIFFSSFSYAKVSAVAGAMCLSFFIGTFSFKYNLSENYEWQLAESSFRGDADKSSISEWQIKEKGISISVKAIPGYDNENAIFLRNGEKINSSYNFFSLVKSKTHKAVIIFKDKSYLLNPGEELGIEIEPVIGYNEIIILCIEDFKSTKLLFSFNISS